MRDRFLFNPPCRAIPACNTGHAVWGPFHLIRLAIYPIVQTFKDNLGMNMVIQTILIFRDRLVHTGIQYWYHRALPKVCRSGPGQAMAERAAVVARALIPDGAFTSRQTAPVAGKA